MTKNTNNSRPVITTRTARADRANRKPARRAYVVVEKAAKMPSSCWGRYARVGLVVVDPDVCRTPAMLSDRARGVVRVVRTFEKRHVGSTDRAADMKAWKACKALKAERETTYAVAAATNNLSGSVSCTFSIG